MDNTPRIFIGFATFHVIGMGSSECARAVLLEVRALTGVEGAVADITIGTLRVRAGSPLDRADIAAAAKRAGHPLDVRGAV